MIYVRTMIYHKSCQDFELLNKIHSWKVTNGYLSCKYDITKGTANVHYLSNIIF